MFRFRKGVKEVPYNRQGYIYFKSLLYKDLPERQRAKIEALCAQAGGPYLAALRSLNLPMVIERLRRPILAM